MKSARKALRARVSSSAVTPTRRTLSSWAPIRLSSACTATPWFAIPKATSTPGPCRPVAVRTLVLARHQPGDQPVRALRRGRGRLARDVGEVLVHEPAQLDRPEVTYDDQGGVVGRVVRPEVRLDVFQPRGIEILHRAHGGVRVGEARRAVEGPEDGAAEGRRVRLVVDAQPLFLFDRGPL